MAILSWGKGLLETAPAGDPKSAKWTKIDTPKEGTLQLTPTAGTEVTATEEGGDIVDSRNPKMTYQLEFTLFVKKGVELPWADTDGVIAGEQMFRYTPEDTETEGFLIARATGRAELNYTVADGKTVHYVFRPGKPDDGSNSVAPYTATAAAPKA